MNTNPIDINLSLCVYALSDNQIFLIGKKKTGLKCEYAYAARMIDYIITFYLIIRIAKF